MRLKHSVALAVRIEFSTTKTRELEGGKEPMYLCQTASTSANETSCKGSDIKPVNDTNLNDARGPRHVRRLQEGARQQSQGSYL